MVTDNFVCGDDHALTPVKAKLGKNVELTLLRKLLPFPEYYEDILVHHPTNHSSIPEGQNKQAINKEKLIVLVFKD